MITCHRRHLEQRCVERGYTLDEVMPCVVSQDGDQWTIDIEHTAFPRTPKPGHEPPSPLDRTTGRGPGTELSRILKRFGVVSAAGCPCNEMAARMDAWGPDGCEQRLDEIVAHLRTQAADRGLPFLDAAGRMLVRQAIKNARRTPAST